MRILVNIVAFYLGWIAGVVLAARGSEHLALVATLAVVGLHLGLSRGRLRQELALVAAAGVAGLTAETLLMGLGLVQYVGRAPMGVLPPLWLTGLWMAFATLLTVSLRPLEGRLALSGFLGLVAAPFSYWAGERLGAMEMAKPEGLSLLAIGAVWAVSLPLLVNLARCFNAAEDVGK
jgi:hypothetical protein